MSDSNNNLTLVVKPERKIYIDVIKIMAIIFVIFNHTASKGFMAFSNSKGIIQFIELFISILCISAVPLFFMCSGVTLLKKKEPLKNIVINRVLKYVLVLIVFTLLYYIFLLIKGGNSSINFNWIFKTMYETDTFSYSGSYWFLYSYIEFLIVLPILRIISLNLTEELIRYILIVSSIALGILPILEYILGLNSIALSIPIITSSNILYPLLGYYYDNNTPTKKRLFLILFIISFLASMGLSLFSLKKGNFSTKYLFIFGQFISIYMFIQIKTLFENHIKLSKRVTTLISSISNCIFGVFLLHGFCLTILNDYYSANSYLDSWLLVIIVFLISLIISYILKKISYVNKLL